MPESVPVPEPGLDDLYQVRPPAPAFDNVELVVVLPDHEGVDYVVSGDPDDGETVTVTAHAVDGWVLVGDGPFEWTHTFELEEPPEIDDGETDPIPEPNEDVAEPWAAGHGQYNSRNAGRRASILEAAEQIANLTDVDNAIDPIADEVHNLGVVVADYGDVLERKVEPWAVPTVAPLSQTINRRADPTFQLQGFMRTELPLAGNTQGADGHWHALTGTHVDAGRIEGALAEGWTEDARTYVAFITPAINRAYEEINFMVGAVSGTPASLQVSIYVTDEDRMLRRQVGPINVSNIIGSGRQLVTIPFDRWVAGQGSYIGVAVHQSGANRRPMLGLYDTPRPLTNVAFPRKITARRATRGAPPSTLDGTNDLDFEADWFTPYIELSEAVGIDYRAFTEGWHYNGPQIGRPWVPLTSQGIGSENGYTRPYGSGLRVSMYDTPLSTDYARVRTSIHRPGTVGRTRRSTLIIRGTNDMRSGVGLSAIGDSHYELIEWANRAVNSNEEWNDRTLIRTISVAPRAGQTIEVDYLRSYVTVRINGTTYIDEQMVGGPQGAAGRFLGIQSRRQSWITWEASPWFGPWSARDLPQDTGGGDGGEEGEEEGGDG